MAGAGVLAAMGALASGIGLVTIAAPRGALVRPGQLPPEVMLIESGDGDRLEPLPDAAFDRRTAVLAGPGLGGGLGDLPRPTAQWLQRLWRESPLPLVYDADALTCIEPCNTGIRAITPHPGEAGRILRMQCCGCAARQICSGSQVIRATMYGVVERATHACCASRPSDFGEQHRESDTGHGRFWRCPCRYRWSPIGAGCGL